MRKTLILCLIALLSVVLIYGFADAKIGGQCANCHTMHNSQDGKPVMYGTQTGPADALLKGYKCLGCHGFDAAGGEYYLVSGQRVPQVRHSTTGTQLAGGNFQYVGTDNDTYVHNVKELGNTEDKITGTFPPGDENKTLITKDNFTCAGTFGCHGDRTVEGDYNAMKGAHHGNQTVAATGANPTTVATSFRFLLGIRGWENDDATYPWQNRSSVIHNEYWGVNTAPNDSTISSPGSNGTISGFCAECHGDFHGKADIGDTTASPFKRHPTDIVLKGTIGSEYAAYTTYSVEAPVARASITTINTAGTNDKVVPGTDIVMCLSCHYAHGSANDDILRWDYSKMVAGGTSSDTGCFTCHTTKNVAPTP